MIGIQPNSAELWKLFDACFKHDPSGYWFASDSLSFIVVSKTYATMVLGEDNRNAESLGLLVAWLVAHDMMSESLESSVGRDMARVRMQDMTGADFLSVVLHGELASAHLSAAGQAFVESYLLTGRYQRDYDGAGYEGENEWHRYDELAPLISAAHQKLNKPQRNAKIIKFPFGGKK